MGLTRVGITGQHGFIGTHLFNYLSLQKEVVLIPFDKDYFDNVEDLERFVKQCDVIVHLAAVNRHQDPKFIYETNISLVKMLITACNSVNSQPHIMFSSSTQEERENAYGRSKFDGHLILEGWAREKRALVTSLIIPNVFGPFGKPFHNSVVATFCYQLTHGEKPHIESDASVDLIYINELVERIFRIIKDPSVAGNRIDGSTKVRIEGGYKKKVSEILSLLESFKDEYFGAGIFCNLSGDFEKALFNTFRCYIPVEYFPRPYKLNSDDRGVFVEIARANSAGQTSFSITFPGITRGNHFHTRKAERFSVIQGKAEIKLRRYQTTEIVTYILNGDNPSYVDIPIWYIHNISNVGEDNLITLFWINEPYDAKDPDTFFEVV